MPRKKDPGTNKPPAKPKAAKKPAKPVSRKKPAAKKKTKPAPKQLQAGADTGKSHPTDMLASKGVKTIITQVDATIPVLIPDGARSPVDDIVEVLKREVIGQDRAIEAIARALLRSQEGFRTPGQPISVMFFAGPTGVGKTETVRALAKALHKDWRSILKIDCSEFSEPHAIARLIGAPPGYIGSDLPATFARENVEGVKNRLILFDEVEKAHFRLHHLLLQIMDEGRITLARRTKDDDATVSFEDCIVIMTSNVGAGDIDKILHANRIGFRNEPSIGDAKTSQQIYVAAKEALKKMFSPEFRNRLTEFIVFHALERKSLFKILQKLLNISAERFATLGFQLMLSDEAKEWLVDRGMDNELGVRPLVRMVEKYIDTKVAELHAYGLIQEGDFLEADVTDSDEVDDNGVAKREIAFFRAPREDEKSVKGKRRKGKKAPKTKILLKKY